MKTWPKSSEHTRVCSMGNEPMEKNTRKILKNGRNSYYVNIPKEIIRKYKWSERMRVTVEDKGKGTVIIKNKRK